VLVHNNDYPFSNIAAKLSKRFEKAITKGFFISSRPHAPQRSLSLSRSSSARLLPTGRKKGARLLSLRLLSLSRSSSARLARPRSIEAQGPLKAMNGDSTSFERHKKGGTVPNRRTTLINVVTIK